MNDILLRKQQSVERCVRRAKTAWSKPSKLSFEKDYDKQDIIVLNLHRACEQVLDMANHLIRIKKLGWPSGSAESFTLLRKADIIDEVTEKKLIGMVGFRNVIVHEYQTIDYKRVEDVVKKHVDSLIEFASMLVAASPK